MLYPGLILFLFLTFQSVNKPSEIKHILAIVQGLPGLVRFFLGNICSKYHLGRRKTEGRFVFQYSSLLAFINHSR
jgi:hypothetical protein